MYLARQGLCSSSRFRLLSRHLRSPARKLSSLAKIKDDLLARVYEPIPDCPTPIPSFLLSRTFHDVFPPRYKDLFRDGAIYQSAVSEALRWTSNQCSTSLLDAVCPPPTYNLLYFPTPTVLSSLLSDGTDTRHSPGPPFTRRVWAGCKISHPEPLHFLATGSKASCHERVLDVIFKGPPGNENVYVIIGRSFSQENLMDDCTLEEFRTLVFMRDNKNSQTSHAPYVAAADRDTSTRSRKVLRSARKRPDFSHTLTASTALLFRFSALTFNAHAIHLDREYCQSVEGHRSLLVHGPLTTILMAELLRIHLADRITQGHVHARVEEASTSGCSYIVPRLTQIHTRNLMPLYADEPMTIYGRRLERSIGALDDHDQSKGKELWELWIDNSDGSCAVKATAETTRLPHRV